VANGKLLDDNNYDAYQLGVSMLTTLAGTSIDPSTTQQASFYQTQSSQPPKSSPSPVLPTPVPSITESKPFQTAVHNCVSQAKQAAKDVDASGSPLQTLQQCLENSGFWPE